MIGVCAIAAAAAIGFAPPSFSLSNLTVPIEVVAYGPTKYDMLFDDTNAASVNATDRVLPAHTHSAYSGYTCKVAAGSTSFSPAEVEEVMNSTGCLATDEAMLESVWRTANPTAFVHEILLDKDYSELTKVPADFDGSLDTLGYSRLMPSAASNCGDEYCPKGPCVVLEMNYFGTAVARRNIESLAADSPENNTNQTHTWNIVRGQTYCGPVAGISPPYKASKVEDVLTHAFPQDRPVPTMYTPDAFAGMILPLARPSKFPNWYFATGYWGWRQNGPMQKNGAPCYGRQVPRWMLPNTCIDGDKGCVNGYSNYATHGKGKQWKHTLVDPVATGMNGVFVSATKEDVRVFDTGKDRFLGRAALLKEALKMIESPIAGVQAAAHFLQPYYSVPDAGLHGYSRWRSEWVAETVDSLDNKTGVYASTQARFPLKASATTWLSRTFAASPNGDVSDSIQFSAIDETSLPDTYDHNVAPQQMRHFDNGQTPQLADSAISARGAWHSHRRLEKFTPQGMDSERGFDALGTRVYMHPYFEYYGGTGPSTEYFECSSSSDAAYNCIEKVFTYGANGNATYNAPFAASFINIDQAMLKWFDSYDNSSAPANAPPSAATTVMPDLNARLDKCLWQGKVKHDKGRGDCCVVTVNPEDADCMRYNDMITATATMNENVETIRSECAGEDDAGKCITAGSHCLAKAASNIVTLKGTERKCDKHYMYRHGQCYSTCTAHVLTLSEINLLRQFVKYPTEYILNDTSSSAAKCSTEDACSNMCNYKSTESSRELCAKNCWCHWMQYLIPPVEVSRLYAAKWDRKDKSGFGGGEKKSETEEWYDANGDNGGDPEKWAAFRDDVMRSNRALLTVEGRFNDRTRKQRAVFSKNAMKGVGIAVGSALAIALSLGTDTAAVLAGDAAAAADGAADAAASVTDYGIEASTTNLVTTGAAFNTGTIAKKSGNSAFEAHTYDETGVDDQLCDLAVCDIATSELKEDSDPPFRCVPRGYAYAEFGKKNTWAALWNGVAAGAGTIKDDALATSNWYAYNDPDTPATDLMNWRSAAFANKRYDFKITLPKGADKSWRGAPTDYSKAVPASFGLNKTEFKPTPKDAGYSQKLHDNNNYACDCGTQGGMEMYTSIDDQVNLDRFDVATAIPYYRADVHAVVEVSIAWTNPNPGTTATKGLYMAGTGGTTEWVERDVMDRRDDALSPFDTYTRFLAPHAPSSEAAIGMVFSREPLNVTVSADDDPTAQATGTDFHGLRQTEFVKEFLTVTANSCVRFPIGVLHRSQISSSIRAKLYGNGTAEHIVTDFTDEQHNPNPLANPGFTPTLQGYCETIKLGPDPKDATQTVEKYRFCPNAPHKTPKARAEFCRANPLASHFLIGVRIDYRPLDRRCSIKHMVCVLVPGSAGDPANRNNFVQGDPSEGLIKAHTTADFAGYTILVTPFNRTTFQSVLSHRKTVPMVIPDSERYMGYMIKDPLTVNANDSAVKKVDESDQSLTGFGENSDFFDIMSDLSGYLSAQSNLPANATQDDAVAEIQRVIDTAINTVFAGAPSSNVTLKRQIAPTVVCPKYTNAPANIEFDPSNLDASRATYIVPNPDQMGGVAKRCIFGARLFPPNPESGIVVTGAGITVGSASTEYPLRFGGEAVGASTCSRFAVAAREFTLTASFNQSGCRQRADAFLYTPVQFMGTDVDHGNVAITTTGSHSVAVSVLGKDSEFFPVPTNLSAQNLRINVTYGNATPRAPGSFDAAFARVHGDSEITVASHDGGGGDATAPVRVRVLLQGIASNDTSAPHKHRAMLKLVGNGVKCVDGTLTDAADDTLGADCEFVNVTEFTSLFGYRFEHRLFRTHVRSTILAWVLLVIFLVVAGVSGVYILVAPAAA